MTIFMVEQNASMALSIANRGYVLDRDHRPHRRGLQPADDDAVKEAYLGRH